MMITPRRTSPLQDLMQAHLPSWSLAGNMRFAHAVPGEEAHIAHLGLADLSHQPRFGIKGPQAANWLAAQGIATPAQPNSWLPLDAPMDTNSFVARLGLTEFLVEGPAATQLHAGIEPAPAGVYPVPREDAEIALLGPQVNALLLQTCNVNFRALDLAARPVVLTSMAGVTVTILPGRHNNEPFYRVWCDCTFGAYLWRTLLEISTGLGGGPIGAALCPKQPQPS